MSGLERGTRAFVLLLPRASCTTRNLLETVPQEKQHAELLSSKGGS